MKTRDVVITVVVTNIIAITVTFFITSEILTSEPQIHKEEIVLTKETLPAPATPIASEQPAVDKEQIIALLDSRKESQGKKALDLFEKVMRDVPPYTGTGTKGYPFAIRGQYEKAEQITKEEIQNNPEVADYYYTLAWIYARTSNYDGAIDVCNKALRRGTAFKKLRYILGWVCARQGRYEDALKTCDEAIRDEPSSAMLYYARGRILELSGRNDEAIGSYSRAISLKSDFSEAYIFRGLLYTKLGRYEEAIKDQKQAIHYNRHDPAGYILLGVVYEQTGNYQGALEQTNNALTLGQLPYDTDSPNQPLVVGIGIDDAVIYNRIGILNVRLGLYEDALIAFNQSIAARQEFPDAYRGLVLTYLLLGDREAAIKNYEKLKRLDMDLANSIAPVVGQDE